MPKEEVDWFAGNDMSLYCTGKKSTGVNNVGNGIALRHDVHHIFDQHMFVFYPVNDRYIVYMVEVNLGYVELLHWLPVVAPKRVAVQFMYSRFAHTIINQIPPFSIKKFTAVAINAEVQDAKKTRLNEKETAAEKKKSVEPSVTTTNGGYTEYGQLEIAY